MAAAARWLHTCLLPVTDSQKVQSRSPIYSAALPPYRLADLKAAVGIGEQRIQCVDAACPAARAPPGTASDLAGPGKTPSCGGSELVSSTRTCELTCRNQAAQEPQEAAGAVRRRGSFQLLCRVSSGKEPLCGQSADRCKGPGKGACRPQACRHHGHRTGGKLRHQDQVRRPSPVRHLHLAVPARPGQAQAAVQPALHPGAEGQGPQQGAGQGRGGEEGECGARQAGRKLPGSWEVQQQSACPWG